MHRLSAQYHHADDLQVLIQDDATAVTYDHRGSKKELSLVGCNVCDDSVNHIRFDVLQSFVVEDVLNDHAANGVACL